MRVTKKLKKIIALLIAITFILGISNSLIMVFAAENDANCKVDLGTLKYTVNGTEKNITVYTQSDYESFVEGFKNGNLPEIYITEFLYDGVGMVKSPDLDDFIDASSNSAEIKTLSIKVINVNVTGNVEFTGEITGAMIAVNTNNITADINLILNGVKIDTDSKKAPVIYVYNKDVNYTQHKVTIKTVAGTKNYLQGGKFKKVSLIGSEELSSYTNYYSGTAKTNYETYTNYYGIYTKEQINNILFAKLQADSEDLADGDPYYYYKGSGAISSDTDLYFEGEGYLSVISKNKEGIETKGNLTFSGGKGDYYILAQDDCLNTTTSSSGNSSARNTLTIDVNSLTAMVDKEADEGDCIDSNGTLTINGGTIYAFAHPTSQDDGLDSEKGTYLNGGTVIAMGNMSDNIDNSSSQAFIKLNFAKQQAEGTIVWLTDTNKTPLMVFKSDRSFTTLTYSASYLQNTTYYVFVGGSIDGEENNGLYTKANSYELGTQQQWTSGGNIMGGGQMEQREMPSGQSMMPQNMEMPSNMGEGQTPPEKPSGNFESNRQTPPDMSNVEMPTSWNMPNMSVDESSQNTTGETSVEFTLSSSMHTFNNVTNSGNTVSTNTEEANYVEENETTSFNYTIIIVCAIIVIIAVAILIFAIKHKKSY